MDNDGIDVQVLSINAFWYGADRDLARRIFDLQAPSSPRCARSSPGRFVGYAPVSLQFPELAAEQLEHGMKAFGLGRRRHRRQRRGRGDRGSQLRPVLEKGRGAAGAGLHPSADRAAIDTGIAKRVQGSGALGNVIGNPLETTLALAHLIFEGTLDRFPNLKICGAHGGGFLPSYAARMDHGCSVFPDSVQRARR